MKKVFPILLTLLSCTCYLAIAQPTVGLKLHQKGSLDSGYVLFAPIGNNTTYLIDKCGKQVHSWTSKYGPGLSVYLLPDGNLLRTGMIIDSNKFLGGAGVGGMIEKIDWNGNLLWSYRLCDSVQCQHHDIEPMPNGNILAVVWENRSLTAARNAGRRPLNEPMSVWSEKIVELKPTGTNGAEIVWEWKVWDHLAQSYDSKAPNYDSIPLHPELIDINYNSISSQDWLHINSVKYNPDLDQIVVSNHNWSEIWIIDHSTTTAQAATHTGGKCKKGGDLLYRWGNPAAYRRGTAADQKLFQQHDPYWIPKGLPNAGKIMIFNNGLNRPAGAYSSVETITTPFNITTNSYSTKTMPYLPSQSDWIYTAITKPSFYSPFISGAQMLTNGNILICNGNSGDLFEINSSKEKVWEYINPVNSQGPVSQGTKASFAVFRCGFYAKDYPAFTGKKLIAGNPIELNPIAYNCYTDSSTNHTNGIAINSYQNDFTVINPFSGELKVKANHWAGKINLDLYDLTGRRIETWNNIEVSDGEAIQLIVPEDVKPGIYFLNIHNDGMQFSTRLVKN
jgi:hypothetical protein